MRRTSMIIKAVAVSKALGIINLCSLGKAIKQAVMTNPKAATVVKLAPLERALITNQPSTMIGKTSRLTGKCLFSLALLASSEIFSGARKKIIDATINALANQYMYATLCLIIQLIIIII